MWTYCLKTLLKSIFMNFLIKLTLMSLIFATSNYAPLSSELSDREIEDSAEDSKHLDISGKTFSNVEQILQISNLQQLELLNMSRVLLSVESENVFYNLSFPYLKTLILDESRHALYSLLRFFNFSPGFADNLELLSINSVGENIESLQGLKNLPSLKILYLNQLGYSKEHPLKDIQITGLQELHIDNHSRRYPYISADYYPEMTCDIHTIAPTIKRLSIKDTNLSVKDFISIANLKNLEWLDLGVSGKFTPIIGNRMRAAQEFTPEITIDISKLLKPLPYLKELSLSGRVITTADFSDFQSLESLNLSKCNLSITSFQTLFSLEKLKLLDIREIKSSNIPYAFIQKLQETLPRCELLYSGKQISDDPEYLLFLNFSKRNSADLQEVINRPYLEELEMSYVVWQNNDSYDFFSVGYFPNLKNLIIDYPQSKFSFAEVPVIPFQNFLNFSENLESLSAKGIDFKHNDLGNLAFLHFLKKLNLSDGIFSKENIEQTQYAELSNLEELHIDNSKIRGAFLNHFTPNLKRLSLKRSNITGNDVSKISELKNLEWLDIASTNITGASIKRLSSISGLRELSLSNTDMSKADFSNLPPSLERLDLSECTLSISSFNTLYSLVDLKKLDLKKIKNTNITPALIQQLREALPNCEMHND